ncbi:DUF2637 domain-containing protein [Streptomyces tendae]|uniref:DUF2637 domain-containing protein n=1 Tax=Streptomyces tendae TaxID=1932 RepID=A0ABX5ZVA3_STRTE|nr:DUF2637 domain-containing protein [Streptomyces tendae]QER88610.1 DUF2637 domain-containing protein [Streptomyces tendae]
MSAAQLRSIERTLSAGTWTITSGAVLFSVLTVTPLVQRVTPAAWDWTAPILPIVVDAAVVIVIRLDATVSRLGERGGRWPTLLRWLTGVFTLALNIGDSALKGDVVGVAVHAVAPMLLIFTAEAALSYRRAISRALDRIARERAEKTARERAEQEARERRQREEREAREQRAREERERERETRERLEREAREHAEQLERERLDREDRRAREEREHAAALERERAEREERERAQEREAAERLRREEQQRAERERAEQLERERLERERVEREQREREAAERAARERREQQARQAREAREREAAARREQSTPRSVNSGERPALTAVPVNEDRKMGEDDARSYVASFLPGSKTVRELADETGWSVGWVSARLREQREQSVAIVPAATGATS